MELRILLRRILRSCGEGDLPNGGFGLLWRAGCVFDKRPRSWAGSFIGFLAVALAGGVTFTLWAAEIYPKPASASPRGAALTAKTLIATLDTLLAEERQLLEATAEIQRELAIVKIRASSPKASE